MPTASLFRDDSTSSTEGWVTAHCDGGARGNPGPAGFGAVFTDASGHKLAELSEFLGHRTNNFAEYSGLLGCLAWALQHNHRRLRVVSDSELMVNQIKGRYKVNSPDLRPLWEEARRRIAQLEAFEITHALRHKNKDADRLANEAMDRGTGRAPAQNQARPAAGPPDRNQPKPTVVRPTTEVSSRPERSAVERPASPPATKAPAAARPAAQMLRGFTRDGQIHLLGGASLPDGIFVKIIPE
ncbi:reverse transcriptase-like protein [Granulicella sp. 5B5]|uniref:ribonuclease HI family protein n=1 Tax=Granulicella sp. 5B5 TaxID=1617967 RepID=UPI0015F61B0E|nr:ribonuclease HI family protein [Granulicella sp. 5B5]QMV18967.1 reverse transcriptase-like protein [Granulicella sp. 5B5]